MSKELLIVAGGYPPNEYTDSRVFAVRLTEWWMRRLRLLQAHVQFLEVYCIEVYCYEFSSWSYDVVDPEWEHEDIVVGDVEWVAVDKFPEWAQPPALKQEAPTMVVTKDEFFMSCQDSAGNTYTSAPINFNDPRLISTFA